MLLLGIFPQEPKKEKRFKMQSREVKEGQTNHNRDNILRPE